MDSEEYGDVVRPNVLRHDCGVVHLTSGIKCAGC